MVFKPGISANPGGKPKQKPFAEALAMEIREAGDNHKALRRCARALLLRASNGDVSALAMLADRLDGKVPQPTGGSDELGPQRLHISWSGSETKELAAPSAGAALIEHADLQPIAASQDEQVPAITEQSTESAKS